MYCSNCGKQISVNDNFCFECGKKVFKTEEKDISRVEERKFPVNKKYKNKQKLCIWIGAIIGILLIASSCIYVMSLSDKEYSGIISEDKTPNDYLVLAKSYVEKGNIYQAREILKEGYKKTKSEELVNVTIWGPISPEEIVIIASEMTMALRTEYCFNENEVKSYYRYHGIVVLETEYFFDDKGRLAGTEMISTMDYTFGGGEFAELCPSNLVLIGETIKLDYVYERYEDGIVEVNWNDIQYMTLIYENGVCSSVKCLDESYNYVFDFEYDSIGRVSQVSYGAEGKDAISYSIITYDEDGSYIVEQYSKGNSLMENVQYDNEGRELCGNSYYQSEFSWNIIWENEKIGKIYEADELMYEFRYDEEGNLIYAKSPEIFGGGVIITSVLYDKNNRIEHIFYDELEMGYNIEKVIDYEGDLIVQVLEKINGVEMTIIHYEYTNKEKIKCIIVDRNDEMESCEFEYDNLGRTTSWTSAPVLYKPGTYTGRAEGWSEDMVVEVTVDRSQIVSIEIIEHGETPGVGTSAIEPMIEKVLDSNSIDVDAVSGSTITSENIINAINNALEQAKL